ncbi:hypothetical protein H257_07481 [Aphanomyces astaci]|uniref:Uncharacterized protein n=1 Tax=Aphanomyces astaci TaxID=112090 RepID=W4GKC4_APHAT|nr:hypothetical protein H257_07481 [Aphanomyces astaci]ETV79484.1 hypothetical protein H257_07481 [Aphanomyces astaci]|eukprot:XP_009831325.1 hypothetical protein H257_07481 [Aphanomyces astaci]
MFKLNARGCIDLMVVVYGKREKSASWLVPGQMNTCQPTRQGMDGRVTSSFRRPSSATRVVEVTCPTSVPGKPVQRPAASQKRFPSQIFQATATSTNSLARDEADDPTGPVTRSTPAKRLCPPTTLVSVAVDDWQFAEPSTAKPVVRRPTATDAETTTTTASSLRHLHEWPDGSTHRLPKNFQFPKLSCDDLWERWLRGWPEMSIGPYRHLTLDDACGMKNHESLKRAQHVMTMLTDAAVSAGLVVSSASLALLRTSELQSVFAAPFWKLPLA